MIANAYNYFIDTCGVMFGLETLLEFLVFNSDRTFVGVIELNREETLMLV
jgi:hypothetical protein